MGLLRINRKFRRLTPLTICTAIDDGPWRQAHERDFEIEMPRLEVRICESESLTTGAVSESTLRETIDVLAFSALLASALAFQSWRPGLILFRLTRHYRKV
jgi:hypothetical protein